MDEELEHVCDECDMGKKTIRKLQEHGITTFRKFLQSGSILNPRKTPENELLNVIEWYKWFKQEKKRDPIILEDFTDEAFDNFKNTAAVVVPETATQDESTVLIPKTMIQDVYPLLKDKQGFVKMVHNDFGMMPTIVEGEVERIKSKMTATMNETLAVFDHTRFSHEVVRAVYTNALHDKEVKDLPLVFVAGKTQVGKSSVNGLAMLSCYEAGAPLVVITHGVQESIGQMNKLKDFARGTKLENHITAISSKDQDGKRMSRKAKDAEIANALLCNGVVVCADTCHQIKRITTCWEQVREDNPNKTFVLIVDECDAVICRTNDRRTQIEQACDEFRYMKPALTVMISATPVPLMIEVCNQPDYNYKAVSGFFSIEPKEDYMGFHQMEQLKDKTGKKVYLDQSELAYGNHYTSSHDQILIEDALSDGTDENLTMPKKGVLLLDCTNPRVYAEGNVRQKAERVQLMCSIKYGRQVVVMINVGKGIEVRLPDEEWQAKKNADVSDVIEEIDQDHGLKMPIFCFGFTKMRRGTSYRSSKRVPTHYIVALGRGHNVMNLVQTLGRATFNGKSILRENGFNAVTLLTPTRDYITVKKLLTYVDYVSEEISSGKSFHDAMTGASDAIPDAANFLRHTTRPVSQIKRHREHLESSAFFERPPVELSEDELIIKEQYLEKTYHQRILRTIFQCTNNHITEVSFNDLLEAYSDTYDQNITKKDLREILRDFARDKVIEKRETSKDDVTDGNVWYYVKERPRLFQYMHEELALTFSEQKEGRTLQDALCTIDYDSAHGPSDDLSEASVESDGSDSSKIPVETRNDKSSPAYIDTNDEEPPEAGGDESSDFDIETSEDEDDDESSDYDIDASGDESSVTSLMTSSSEESIEMSVREESSSEDDFMGSGDEESSEGRSHKKRRRRRRWERESRNSLDGKRAHRRFGANNKPRKKRKTR
eukprot:scaffold640_cov166-Amphora_coffeaeformis.AAC.1